MNAEESFMPDAPPKPADVSVNEAIDDARFGNNIRRFAKLLARHIAPAAPCIALINYRYLQISATARVHMLQFLPDSI